MSKGAESCHCKSWTKQEFLHFFERQTIPIPPDSPSISKKPDVIPEVQREYDASSLVNNLAKLTRCDLMKLADNIILDHNTPEMLKDLGAFFEGLQNGNSSQEKDIGYDSSAVSRTTTIDSIDEPDKIDFNDCEVDNSQVTQLDDNCNATQTAPVDSTGEPDKIDCKASEILKSQVTQLDDYSNASDSNASEILKSQVRQLDDIGNASQTAPVYSTGEPDKIDSKASEIHAQLDVFNVGGLSTITPIILQTDDKVVFYKKRKIDVLSSTDSSNLSKRSLMKIRILEKNRLLKNGVCTSPFGNKAHLTEDGISPYFN